MEGYARKNATGLLEITHKVFVNCDRAARKEADPKNEAIGGSLSRGFGNPAPPGTKP